MFTPLTSEELIDGVGALLRGLSHPSHEEEEMQTAEVSSAASVLRFLRVEVSGRPLLIDEGRAKAEAAIGSAALELGTADPALAAQMEDASQRAKAATGADELAACIADALVALRDGEANRPSDEVAAAHKLVLRLAAELSVAEGDLLRSALSHKGERASLPTRSDI